MNSSRTTVLFSTLSDLDQQPSSLVASILIHTLVLGLLSVGIMYTPAIEIPLTPGRQVVRRLDLHTPEHPLQRAGEELENVNRYSVPRSLRDTPPLLDEASALPPVIRRITHGKIGPQTLVQPDISSPITLPEKIPVPAVIIWTPQKTQVKVILAPLPDKPTAAHVIPSLTPPNEELNLAELGVSATDLAAQNQPVVGGTTSPVVFQDPDLVEMAPTTASQDGAEPTPAALVSLSDLRAQDATVTLPPVSETAPEDSPKSSREQYSALTAKGNSGMINAGSTTGQGADSTRGRQSSITRISLPKDGHFTAVVVGNSLESEFPELAEVWSGRLVYTVYLHVGLAKNWILQYSLPREADTAASGERSRLDAPWPYSIVRPNLDPSAVDADALMVRGFVNQSGRFESLTIVFPQDCAQAQFVLNTLQQWQFRPAKQDGRIARVEVLLIIPEDLQ
jgi:hypothetical protein